LTSLPSQPRVLEQTRRASLWNSPVLFLVFLACVTVEWIVRRRHQLV
jgi:cytochrome c-type biogenesis protein CcmH/NrfF